MEVYKDLLMTLYAAGETLEGNDVVKILEELKCEVVEYSDEDDDSGVEEEIPEELEGTGVDKMLKELKIEKEELQLKHICREAIRKHLLKLDPHQHLFGRIPRLGLPSALNQYLLFGRNLDDGDIYEIYYSDNYDQWQFMCP